jgi:hypothetical protein
LYTATASQTTFSGTDTQNLTLSYSDSNFIDVHQNGVLLKVVDDYTATSGTSVVLATGATASDVIEITVYDVFSIANHIKKTGDAMAGALTNIDIDGTELVLDADGDTSITADTDDRVDIKIAGTDTVHITSTGLGVGTNAPNRALSLENGDIQIHDTGTSGDPLLNFSVGNTQGSPTQSWSLRIDNSDSDKFQLMDVTDSRIVLTADGSGNVGIGTASPSVLLDLESTAPVIRFTDSDATGTPECEVSGAGGDITIRADRDNEKSSSIIGFEVDGSEKMRILSGGGITFNGDTATANALDDYEEGTWVPALTGPSSVAYSSQIGNYTKIGRMVFLSFSMTISSGPTTGSNYRIVIPFTPEGSSSREYGGDIFVDTAMATHTGSYFLGVYAGTTNIYVYNNQATAFNGQSNWTTGTLSGHIFINT